MLSNTCSAIYLDLSSGLLRIPFKSIQSNQTRLLKSYTFIIPGILLELSKTPAHMSGSQSRRLLVWYTLAFVPSTRSAEDPESMFTFNIFQPNVFPKKYPKISENVPKMHFASGINSEIGGMIMGGSGIGGVQW